MLGDIRRNQDWITLAVLAVLALSYFLSLPEEVRAGLIAFLLGKYGIEKLGLPLASS